MTMARGVDSPYTGACLLVLYGRNSTKSDAIQRLSDAAKSMGLRVTIVSSLAKFDPPTDRTGGTPEPAGATLDHHTDA